MEKKNVHTAISTRVLQSIIWDFGFYLYYSQEWQGGQVVGQIMGIGKAESNTQHHQTTICPTKSITEFHVPK